MTDVLDLDAYRNQHRQKALDPKQRYRIVLEEVDRQLAQYKEGPPWWKILIVGLVSLGLISLFAFPLMFLLQSLKVKVMPWQLIPVLLSFTVVLSIATVTLGNFLVEQNLRRAKLFQVKLALLSVLSLRSEPASPSFEEWRREAIVYLLDIVPEVWPAIRQRKKELHAQTEN